MHWAGRVKVGNHVNVQALRNICFAIFDSHLNYFCIIWAQNINTVNRLIILKKKALRIMNFKDLDVQLSLLIICGALHDLVPCAQFKNVKNTHGGMLPATSLKVTLLHRCFSRFLNCTNGTKSRKAHILKFGGKKKYILKEPFFQK